jgi:hypothetical protein
MYLTANYERPHPQYWESPNWEDAEPKYIPDPANYGEEF